MFLSILSEWIFIASFQPSIQKAESTWASGWYLNNSPCYFYIHFMSFHDSGLFLFFIPSIDLGSRLHSTLPPVILLVNSYSCSKTFLRAASSFVGSSIPSMYHLCFFIALYSHCILLWNFPNLYGYYLYACCQTLCSLILHLTSTSASGPNCLIKTLLLLLQVCTHQSKRQLG